MKTKNQGSKIIKAGHTDECFAVHLLYLLQTACIQGVADFVGPVEFEGRINPLDRKLKDHVKDYYGWVDFKNGEVSADDVRKFAHDVIDQAFDGYVGGTVRPMECNCEAQAELDRIRKFVSA